MGTGHGDDDVTPLQSILDSLVAAVRLATQSIWHVAVLLGVVLLVLPKAAGWEEGVWSGMVPVWGVTSLFVGIAGYAVIWGLRRRYGQQAASDFLE